MNMFEKLSCEEDSMAAVYEAMEAEKSEAAELSCGTSSDALAPWDWDAELNRHKGLAIKMGVDPQNAREVACILASRAFTVLSAFEAASQGQRGYYDRLLREVSEMDEMLAKWGIS